MLVPGRGDAVPACLRLFARCGKLEAMARCVWVLLLLTGLAAARQGEWPAYGNDPGGMRYSPLKQIDRSNVQRLKVAWIFHTGALKPASDANRKAAFEATPILVDGTLYLSTPFDQVIALDPGTGARK
ncbi:MAG: pyrroloquinoline quinone-dependent dehydrogenase, partial [Bryobacteraceae bacterium]